VGGLEQNKPCLPYSKQQENEGRTKLLAPAGAALRSRPTVADLRSGLHLAFFRRPATTRCARLLGLWLLSLQVHSLVYTRSGRLQVRWVKGKL